MKRFKIYHDDDIIGGQIPDSWEELTVKQWAALRPDDRPRVIEHLIKYRPIVFGEYKG
jgi:hypothetical protein